MTDIQSQKRLDALSAYVVFTGQNGENVGILLTRKEDVTLYQFFSREPYQLVKKNDVENMHGDESFLLHSAIKLNTSQRMNAEHAEAISRRMIITTHADRALYESPVKWLAKYLGIVEKSDRNSDRNSDRKFEKLAEMVVAHGNAAKPKSVVSIVSVMQETPMAKEVWWYLE